MVKVHVGECHNSVIKSNCVIARWGGEQLEMKDQSVGDELDSAGCCGEHAWVLRSLKIITYVDVARKEKKRYVGASSGWRWNGRKFMRDKQGYLRVRENTGRSQSLHSTVSCETAQGQQT